MKMPQNLKIITFVALFIIFVASCNHQEPVIKIGVSQCSSDEWRDKMNNEMRREMLFHDDAIIEIRSADDSNEKQIEDIEYFLENGFDLIILAPNEATDDITEEVRKVYDAGVPVIIFDRKIKGDYYTAYIDLDNKGIGESAAHYMNTLLPQSSVSEVVEITGLTESTPAVERHSGFVEGLKTHPNLHLMASVAGNWEREKAYELADSLLEVFPNIKAIFAQSDNMALGVSQLLKEKGRDDIRILGTDASPGQGLEAVRDSLIDATFIYPTEGHRIIKTAFSILNNEKFEKVVHIPSLSSVDKSNAEILIRQHELLRDETEKVLLLNDINTVLDTKYRTLNRFSNTILVLAIVLGVIFILLLLAFIRNRKLQKELKEQNQKLIEERDKQIGLYQQLDQVLSKENDFYSRFMNIIRTQYMDPSLNTEVMSQQLSLGSAQLTRKIKSLTNFSPVEILRNHRLETARNLLLTTGKNINEITFEVGFTSPAYLTKCFREHFGQTPTELRSGK